MEANRHRPLKARPSPAREHRAQSENKHEAVRKLALYLTLALVFIRCAWVHEWITYQFYFNSYVLYIVGIPAVLGLFASKRVRRPFRFPQAYFWLGFSLWMVLVIPFAFWRGGALEVVKDYWRTNVMLVFLLGGLITTWKEFEYLLRVLAASCVVNLLIIRLYAQNMNGRTSLPFGALANSNDYAAHLLMLVPAVLWLTLTAKSFKLRILALGIVGYTVLVVLSSASRGALISVAAGTLYFLISASTKQRVWALGLGAIMAFTVFSVLPRETIQRMLTFSKSSTASEEALMSSEERSRVLQDAVYYAFTHPIFGLGPNNFRVVEGRTRPLLYAPAHNSYVAAACECGFPGFILFMGGVITSFLTFLRIKRKFQGDSQAKRITDATVCMQVMMVMFCIAVGFLNFTYSAHFPIIVGISIAMAYATENWESRSHPALRMPQTAESNESKTPNFHRYRKPSERVSR